MAVGSENLLPPLNPAAAGKMIVSGTGRAGTTLLMRIFTRLGLDTGFTEADIAQVDSELCKAGLEKPINAQTAAGLPAIIKTPYLTELLAPALRDRWFKVDHAIIPVRTLDEAAGSRASVSERSRLMGGDPFYTAGGLWDVKDPAEQPAELARKFHALIDTLVANDIPITFLHFPRFAQDPEHFVAALGELAHNRFGVSRQELRQAHAHETNLSYIGKFLP